MDIDQHLRLRHLRSFLEIARSQSVSAAAKDLNVTQPAVSRSLKELEGILGTPLFDRIGRGLKLNEAGRVFQAHANAAMVELIRGHDRVVRQGAQTQRLSIGVLPTAATELVPQAALLFHAQMPNVRTHILTGPNWLLFDQLRAGRVDLVVGRMPENEAAVGVSFHQLYTEEVVIACRSGHPILGHVRPETEIADYPVIMPPRGAMIASSVERYLTSIGLPELRGIFETVALPIGRKLVARSDALWFISQGVVADDVADGGLACLALASPILSGPVGISVTRAAPINAARATFFDALVKVAQEI